MSLPAKLAPAVPTPVQVALQNGLAWVSEALGALPEEAATAADRQRFLTACQQVVAEGIGINDEKVLQVGEGVGAGLGSWLRYCKCRMQAGMHGLVNSGLLQVPYVDCLISTCIWDAFGITGSCYMAYCFPGLYVVWEALGVGDRCLPCTPAGCGGRAFGAVPA